MIFKKKDGTEVVTYTNEERAAALEVSLTSLASYLGFTPVRTGTHYHLKEMDSLVIYNDRTWNRWSGKGSITGGTQIDFMMEYGEATDVPEAVKAFRQLQPDLTFLDIEMPEKMGSML